MSAAAAEGRALVPRSSARPHIHGGSYNLDTETISFEKMDRILKISRHDRYARGEAGFKSAAAPHPGRHCHFEQCLPRGGLCGERNGRIRTAKEYRALDVVLSDQRL